MVVPIRAAGLLVLLACALLQTSFVEAEQGTIFRAQSQHVPVYVTVIGADDRLVTHLDRRDFQVLDNGRPQPLTIFDAGVQPISVIVMLDMSGSMLGNMSLLRTSAVQMFTRLLPADRARIGSFGDRIVISPTFTNDVDTLIRSLWFDLEPGGSTPLWAAINAAMSALSPLEGRRVVLVLSDGRNTGRRGTNSGPSLEEVARRAQVEDFMVYAIGIRSRMGGTPARGGRSRGPRVGGAFPSSPGSATNRVFGGVNEPDPGLRELALDTGGGYVDLNGLEDLGAAFARVADELHQQYLLGYVAPESDGKIHQIEVRTSNPLLTPRARRTYLAPRR